MRRILRGLIYTLAIAEGVCALVAGVLAYGIRSVAIPDGAVRDGLGRELTRVPLLARAFLTEERLWAGWGWFVLDLGVFVAALGLGAFLLGLADRLRDREASATGTPALATTATRSSRSTAAPVSDLVPEVTPEDLGFSAETLRRLRALSPPPAATPAPAPSPVGQGQPTLFGPPPGALNHPTTGEPEGE